MVSLDGRRTGDSDRDNYRIDSTGDGLMIERPLVGIKDMHLGALLCLMGVLLGFLLYYPCMSQEV